MDISSLMPSTQMTAGENLVASLLNTTTSTTSTDPMTAVLTGEQQLLAMSSIGQTANQAYNTAMASGNQSVIAGFQQAMKSLYAQPLNVSALTQLQAVNQIAAASPTTFNSIFSTVNTLNQQGLSATIQPLLTTVNTAYAKSGTAEVDSLITQVSGALNATGADNSSLLNTLTNLFSQYAAATSSTTV